jgi:hypothetical protein
MTKRKKITFKVWIEIERYNERTDHGETMDAPGSSLAAFDTYEEAWDYADRVMRLAEPISLSAADLPTRFDGYEIHGIKKLGKGRSKHAEQVPDEQAQFWSLFGHIPGQGIDCIGDFATRGHAEEIYARITGRRYA